MIKMGDIIQGIKIPFKLIILEIKESPPCKDYILNQCASPNERSPMCSACATDGKFVDVSFIDSKGQYSFAFKRSCIGSKNDFKVLE